MPGATLAVVSHDALHLYGLVEERANAVRLVQPIHLLQVEALEAALRFSAIEEANKAMRTSSCEFERTVAHTGNTRPP